MANLQLANRHLANLHLTNTLFDWYIDHLSQILDPYYQMYVGKMFFDQKRWNLQMISIKTKTTIQNCFLTLQCMAVKHAPIGKEYN